MRRIPSSPHQMKTQQTLVDPQLLHLYIPLPALAR
jgi:hypothetical protein